MDISFDPNNIARVTDSLQVEMVRNVITGDVIDVLSWIPTKTEGEIHKLRTQIRQSSSGEEFVCFYCGYPVLLRKHQLGSHYFAHIKKDVSEKAQCIYQQYAQISIEDRNRIRYQGQREGKRHIHTKELITKILESDPSFSDIKVESVWKTFDDGWRKPDVYAKYNGIEVVFEVQISNTYPQVVAERTDFYRKQKALLIWIFDTIASDSWRTLHSDNFSANGQHLFLADKKCYDVSLQCQKAHFEIYYQKPIVFPCQRDDGRWLLSIEQDRGSEIIPFSELLFNIEEQTATCFSISHENWIVNHKKQCAIAQADRKYGDLEKSMRVFIGEHRKISIATLYSWPVLICAIEAARLGKPIGTKYTNVVSLFNLVYDNHHQFLTHLIWALEKMSMTPEKVGGAWENRVRLFKLNKYQNKDRSIVDMPHQHLTSMELLKHVYPNL